MPCTGKKAFASAARTGNALLVRVKANQPGLHDALVSLCAERDPLDRHATVDRGRHGREEHRRVELFAVAGRLPPEGREVVACAARITVSGVGLPRVQGLTAVGSGPLSSSEARHGPKRGASVVNAGQGTGMADPGGRVSRAALRGRLYRIAPSLWEKRASAAQGPPTGQDIHVIW